MVFTNQNTTLKDFLIAFLCSAKSTKKFYQILNDRAFENYKASTVRSTLSRLHKEGLVVNQKNQWGATRKGIDQLAAKKLFSKFESPFDKNTKPNTLIAFDIPEKERTKRHWLRGQLKIYGYTMIQQSLWYGPGPLPKECLERFSKLEIRERLKIFKINLKR